MSNGNKEQAPRGPVPSVRGVLGTLERRRGTIGFCTVLALLCALGWLATSRPMDRAPATLLLAGLIGSASGILLALVRDRISGHMSSAAELESVTDLAVLGSIPNFRRGSSKIRGARSDFIALLDDPDGITADAYRSLRASLRSAARGEGQVRVLGITSAVASEGKSSTNLNIALASAAAGERILLVDGDLRRPALHRFLELSQSPGLGEALLEEGGTPWRDSIQHLESHGLDIVTAGKGRASSGDLLADSDRLDRFLLEAREAYDLVLLDLPPVLTNSDALSVASRLDAVILLYKSEGAPAGALRLAAGQLSRSGANIIGAVLCALRPTRHCKTKDSLQGDYVVPYGNESGNSKGQRLKERAA